MIKVVLAKDVKGLGKKDDVVNVKDGYARNYLIPRGLVLEANAATLNEARKKEEANRNREDKEKANAIKLTDRINGLTLTLHAKTGESGRLFGSITSADISVELKKQYNVEIDKKKIVLSEPIKHICETQVEIKLYPGVTCNLTVKVEGDQ